MCTCRFTWWVECAGSMLEHTLMVLASYVWASCLGVLHLSKLFAATRRWLPACYATGTATHIVHCLPP